MIIVIDGYNVLKQMSISRVGDTRGRDTFIAQLDSYAARKRHRVVVVFDGGPYDRPYREDRGAVQVIYSGSGQTADEYIGSYLKTQQNVELLLVSSDHELCVYADSLDFVSIDSYCFYRILQDTLYVSDSRKVHRKRVRSNGQIVKLHGGTSPELDACMQEAVRTMVSKDAIESAKTRSITGHAVARRERRLLNILKKL